MIVEQEIVKIEERVKALTELMIKPEEDALLQLTAKGLTWGHSTGTIESRKEFINSLVSGRFNFTLIDIQSQTVSVLEGTAVARHVLVAETHHTGEDRGLIRIGVVLVWCKLEDEWLLLARQAYKL